MTVPQGKSEIQTIDPPDLGDVTAKTWEETVREGELSSFMALPAIFPPTSFCL